MSDKERLEQLRKKHDSLRKKLRRTQLNLELWKHRYHRDVIPVRSDTPANRQHNHAIDG